jgi:hypothetical protein
MVVLQQRKCRCAKLELEKDTPRRLANRLDLDFTTALNAGHLKRAAPCLLSLAANSSDAAAAALLPNKRRAE